MQELDLTGISDHTLFECFSTGEFEEFKSILNGRILDEKGAIKVLTDVVIKGSKGKHNSSLSEYTEDNKELARLLLRAFDRYEYVDKGETREIFVFENKDPREDYLQRQLLIDMVKDIRSLTGLSQAKFSEQYDINKRSLQAWESGAKKISKYAYNYLKNAITDNTTIISTVREVNLPIKILDKESIDYLKVCSDEQTGNPKAMVRHIEESPWMGEAYILYLEKYETLDNGRVENQWDSFPEGLKKCIRPVADYNISDIVFDYDEELCPHYKELIDYSGNDIEGKLKEIMKSNSKLRNS